MVTRKSPGWIEVRSEIAVKGVRIVSKDDSRLMRFAGFFLKDFMTGFWTTLRFPFGKPTIYTPINARGPEYHYKIIWHELKHVDQFAPWYGPLIMLIGYTIAPLPIFFSGRWLIERTAYLRDINSGRMTAEQCVDILWRSYFMPWPKSLMLKWFEKNKGRDL
jgi:hypothetical protein